MKVALIFSGFGISLHHYLKYGRWYDKGKKIWGCHGKFGLFMAFVGSLMEALALLW